MSRYSNIVKPSNVSPFAPRKLFIRKKGENKWNFKGFTLPHREKIMNSIIGATRYFPIWNSEQISDEESPENKIWLPETYYEWKEEVIVIS